jgi:hypothetical protein
MAKAGDAYRELVGTVMAALDIGSAVKTEQWIQVHSRPIGINYIDAFESKIRDLQPNRALMFSNSGFTRDARRKATRVGIELASAMKANDNKIKIQVHREVVAKCVTLLLETVTLFPAPAQLENGWQVDELFFEELPVIHWMAVKMQELAIQHEDATSLCFLCTFSYSQGWSYRGSSLTVGAMKMQFNVVRTWVAQTVREDVSLGYYDHLRKCVVVPSQQWYTEGVYDQEAWEETDKEWDCRVPEPNSFGLWLTLIRTNLNIKARTPPNVDSLIVESMVEFEPDTPPPMEMESKSV